MSEYAKCGREVGKCVGLKKGIKAYHKCVRDAGCLKKDREKLTKIKKNLEIANAKKVVAKLVKKGIIKKKVVVKKAVVKTPVKKAVVKKEGRNKEQNTLMGFVKSLTKYTPLTDKTYNSIMGYFTSRQDALNKLGALIRDFLHFNNQTDIINILTLNKTDKTAYDKIMGLVQYNIDTEIILHSKLYKYYMNKIKEETKLKKLKPKNLKTDKPKKYAHLFK